MKSEDPNHPKWKDQVSFDEVLCVRKTPKAIVVDIEGNEYLIPDSEVSPDSEVWKEGQEGTLIIARWIARDRGLTDE